MYFISRNNKKEGPLSLEEVKKLTLTEDILVWKEGLLNWVTIKEIPELKDSIVRTPPPLPIEIENEKNTNFHQFRMNESKKIILRNILIGVVIGIILAINHYYQATHSAGENIDNKYPIYLSYEQREHPYLIFWHILPYTLIVGQVIMLLVTGFQVFRIEPIVSKIDSDVNIPNVDLKTEIIKNKNETYIKDYGNKLIYKIQDSKRVENIFIQEFLQPDKSILDVEIKNNSITYGSRAWLHGILAEDGMYNINGKSIKIENGKLIKS